MVVIGIPSAFMIVMIIPISPYNHQPTCFLETAHLDHWGYESSSTTICFGVQTPHKHLGFSESPLYVISHNHYPHLPHKNVPDSCSKIETSAFRRVKWPRTSPKCKYSAIWEKIEIDNVRGLIIQCPRVPQNYGCKKGIWKRNGETSYVAYLVAISGVSPFSNTTFHWHFIVDHHVPQCFLQHLPHAGPNIGSINLTILVYHQHVY